MMPDEQNLGDETVACGSTTKDEAIDMSDKEVDEWECELSPDFSSHTQKRAYTHNETKKTVNDLREPPSSL